MASALQTILGLRNPTLARSAMPDDLDTPDKLAILGGMLSNLGGDSSGLQTANALLSMRQSKRAAQRRQAGLQALFGDGGEQEPAGDEAPAQPSPIGWSGDLSADLGFGPAQQVKSAPKRRAFAKRAATALSMGLAPEEINSIRSAEEFDLPKFTNVNGFGVDERDPANVGKFFPKLAEGEEPLFDGAGNVVGARNLQGHVRAVGETTRAQEDAKSSSEASYARVTASEKAEGELPTVGRRAAAEAGGKAPYEFVEVTGPNGEPMMVSRAYLAGREGSEGPIVGQNPQDAEYGKSIAGSAAEGYKTLQSAGGNAAGKIAKFQQIDKLLTEFEGNRLAPTGLEIARMANGFGFKISDKMSNAEAAQALSNELALEARNPSSGAGMPGALSNSDRVYLQQLTPGLAQTSQGRHKLVQIHVSLAQRDQAIAGMARQWQQRYKRIDAADPTGKTFQDYLGVWADKNPLFAR